MIGVEELEGELSSVLPGPLRWFFEAAAITVQGNARKEAPVDQGHLRNSIGYEVDKGQPPLQTVVGVDAPEGSPLWFKARAMEWGTGRRGDPAVSHKKGHWPPAAALDRWAHLHGLESGAVVAEAIGKRGGLDPRHYLQKGLAASVSKIDSLLKEAGSRMEDEFGASIRG